MWIISPFCLCTRFRKLIILIHFLFVLTKEKRQRTDNPCWNISIFHSCSSVPQTFNLEGTEDATFVSWALVLTLKVETSVYDLCNHLWYYFSFLFNFGVLKSHESPLISNSLSKINNKELFKESLIKEHSFQRERAHNYTLII